MHYSTEISVVPSEAKEFPKSIDGIDFKFRLRNINTEKTIIGTTNNGKFNINNEIIIEATSIRKAQYALDLINAAICLVESVPIFSLRDLTVYPINSKERPLYKTTAHGFSTFGILTACKIAAQISFDVSDVNAVIKYFLSCDSFCMHWIDLDPSHSPNIPLSPFPYDYLRYGNAIIQAYSVIEELELAVNASVEKPSFKDKKWNPVVKKDLEDRLINAGIDLNDLIVWQRRGRVKAIEDKLDSRRIRENTKKTPWTRGTVRDYEIPIIDAISDISWIRSCVASHKSKTLIRSLSVYDVDNAQHLARRLLLEKLGFWKNITKLNM